MTRHRAIIGSAMVPQCRRRAHPLISLLPSLLVTLAAILVFSAGGCKTSSHTSDSRLQKIDELLNAKLPKGTPRSRVSYFLTSRGYQLQDSPDKDSLVAVVRHIDTDTLQPSTAVVTFHFDANNNLTTYNLQPAPDAPLHP
jgi:hypothetical protein